MEARELTSARLGIIPCVQKLIWIRGIERFKRVVRLFTTSTGGFDLKIAKVLLFSLVLGSVLTGGSILRYETEIIPDFEVTMHGVPLFWLHHQTSSIAGPVDVWSVQWTALVVDFALWFIMSVAIVYLLDRYATKI